MLTSIPLKLIHIDDLLISFLTFSFKKTSTVSRIRPMEVQVGSYKKQNKDDKFKIIGRENTIRKSKLIRN